MGYVDEGMIAEAAAWPRRKAPEFVKALVDARFIDIVESGYALHNWYKYAGKLNDKKRRDRERKTEVAANSSGIPTEVARKSQAPNLPNQPTNQTDLPNLTNPIDRVCSDFAQFGKVTARTSRAIEEAVKDNGIEWVTLAVKKARASPAEGEVSWNYVDSILERWKKQGGTDEPRLQTNSRSSGRSKANAGVYPGPDIEGWKRYAAGQD